MSNIGRGRELKVCEKLREEGWFAIRAHLSVADVIALREGDIPRFIEVKSTSTRGPFNDFGPADRARLLSAAALAGAEAMLAWWPARGKLTWIPSAEWPAGGAA